MFTAILLSPSAGAEPRIGELSIYAPPISGHLVDGGALKSGVEIDVGGPGTVLNPEYIQNSIGVYDIKFSAGAINFAVKY